MTLVLPPYAKLTPSKWISPRATTRGRASGASTTTCLRASVVMPSCTVPMCSNKAAISHITQCEMPFRRSAIAVAAATAPTEADPCVHNQSAAPAVDAMSPMLSTWFTISKPVTSRICVWTVTRNSCIAERT